MSRRFRVPASNRLKLTGDGVARKPLLPAFGHSEASRHVYRGDMVDRKIKLAKEQKMVLFNRGQGAGGGYWQDYGKGEEPDKSERSSPRDRATSHNASVVEKSTHQIPSVAVGKRKRHSEVPALAMNRTMEGFSAKKDDKISIVQQTGTTDRSEPRSRADANMAQDSVFSKTSRGGGSRIKERLSPIRLELLRGGYPAPVGLGAQRSLA